MIGAYLRGSLSLASRVKPHAKRGEYRFDLCQYRFQKLGWVWSHKVERSFREKYLFFSPSERVLIGYYASSAMFLTSQDSLLAEQWEAQESMPAVVSDPNYARITWQGVLPPRSQSCELSVKFNDVSDPIFIGGTLLHADMTDAEAQAINLDLRLLEQLKRLVA